MNGGTLKGHKLYVAWLLYVKKCEKKILLRRENTVNRPLWKAIICFGFCSGLFCKIWTYKTIKKILDVGGNKNKDLVWFCWTQSSWTLAGLFHKQKYIKNSVVESEHKQQSWKRVCATFINRKSKNSKVQFLKNLYTVCFLNYCRDIIKSCFASNLPLLNCDFKFDTFPPTRLRVLWPKSEYEIQSA